MNAIYDDSREANREAIKLQLELMNAYYCTLYFSGEKQRKASEFWCDLSDEVAVRELGSLSLENAVSIQL